MKRLLSSLLLVCCLILLPAGLAGAAARPGLVKSYGAGGIADVGSQAADVSTIAWAAAADGSAYTLRAGRTQCAVACTRPLSVVRFGRDGRLDPSFGAGFGSVTLATSSTPADRAGLAVDAGGRLLATWQEGGDTVLARFDSDGTLDTSFGSGGQVRLSCQCGLGEGESGVVQLPGSRLLLRQASRTPSGNGTDTLRLWALSPDGAVDRSFGEGGSANFDYAYGAVPTLFAPRSNGSVLLAGGPGCCVRGHVPHLYRLSVRGRIAPRFTANARRSLRALPRRGEFASINSVIARRNGTVDVLGRSRSLGFDLRLRADGSRARSFGRRGLRLFSWPVDAAARDAGGGVFAVSEDRMQKALVAHRLYPGGYLDRRFGGTRGAVVASLPIVDALAATTLSGGRAMAYVGGLPECRYGNCLQQPRLVLFQEPSLDRRR